MKAEECRPLSDVRWRNILTNKLLVLHARQQDQDQSMNLVKFFRQQLIDSDTLYDPTLSLANIKLVTEVLVKIGPISK